MGYWVEQQRDKYGGDEDGKEPHPEEYDFDLGRHLCMLAQK